MLKSCRVIKSNPFKVKVNFFIILDSNAIWHNISSWSTNKIYMTYKTVQTTLFVEILCNLLNLNKVQSKWPCNFYCKIKLHFNISFLFKPVSNRIQNTDYPGAFIKI